MKKILPYLVFAAFAWLSFVSCSPVDGGGDDFDESLLYSGSGEWVSTQDFGDGPEEIHDKFLSNGSGSTWSATLDTPPQSFTWTVIDGRTLRFVHNMDVGGGVPKEYTLEMLTQTRLVYRDEWSGGAITCTKL